MKKTTKVIALVIVMVMAVSLLCSCDMITTNTLKYRSQTAITVGSESISVGDFLDTYTSYYYDYYSYIQQGYFTDEQLFELVVSSLVQIHLRIDEYKNLADASGDTYSHQYVDVYKNSEYLTEAETEFAIKYALNSMYKSFNSYLEQEIAKFYDLAEAEADDDEREFTEYDVVDTSVASPYAEYKYQETMDEDEIDERVDVSNLPTDFSGLGFGAQDTYENNELLAEKVDEINERIVDYIKAQSDYKEGDEDNAPVVTADEYKEFEKRAAKAYKRAADDSYGYTFALAISTQVESTIKSMIAVKYNYRFYRQVESEQNLLTILADNWANDKSALEAAYQLAPSKFVQAIEGLQSTDFIYTIPSQFADSYVYTKNLLIQFSAEQSTALSTVKSRVGADSETYKEYRAWLAGQIVAENFTDAYDGVDFDDYTDQQIAENTFFQYVSGTSVELVSGSTLETALNGGLTEDVFVQLMKDYNTDVAQHKANYDYVVRVDGTPLNYQATWVVEYVEAAKQAYESYNAGGAGYGIAISDYGVHVVYYTGNLVAQDGTFTTDSIYDLSTHQSRYFQAYYDAKSQAILAEAFDQLVDKYLEEDLVQWTKIFEKIMKNAEVEVKLSQVLEDLKD